MRTAKELALQWARSLPGDYDCPHYGVVADAEAYCLECIIPAIEMAYSEGRRAGLEEALAVALGWDMGELIAKDIRTLIKEKL